MRQTLGKLTPDNSTPLILAVTHRPPLFKTIPAMVDFALDAVGVTTNLKGCRLLGSAYLAVLVDGNCPTFNPFDIIQSIQASKLHQGGIYLVKDGLETQELSYARQLGLAGVLHANPDELKNFASRRMPPPVPASESPLLMTPPALRTVSTSTVTTRPVAPPPHFDTVVEAMKEFLASEAEPRITHLYQQLVREAPTGVVSANSLIDEAAHRLLDEVQEQQAFVKFARQLWSQHQRVPVR